jgi:hypothetical protein
VFKENKTHEVSYRTPQEVYREVLDADIGLSIDRAGSFDEILGALPAILETDLPSIEFWTAPFSFLGPRSGVVSHSIGFYPRNEMVSLFKEGLDYFLAGVVGIGNEYRFLS